MKIYVGNLSYRAEDEDLRLAFEPYGTVESAEVSHEKGTAVVTLSADTPFDTLKAAVEELDYKVIQ